MKRIRKDEGVKSTVTIEVREDSTSSSPPGQKELEEAKNIFRELGSRGLSHFGGAVDEEWLRKLQGDKAVKEYKEMRDNDPIVGAILYAIEMLSRQVEWSVEPFSKSPEDIENAEFLESVMHDMSTSWVDTIGEILSMLTFGWAYHEIVYKVRKGPSQDPETNSKYDDGRIGWRKIPIRAQESLERWDIAEDGGIRGLWQSPPPDYKLRYIPIERALLFRTSTKKNNPQGRSILRNAYRPWYFKKRIEEIEGVGIERDLAGLPVCLAPSRIMRDGADAADKTLYEHLKKLVRQVRRDEQEGIVFPNDRDEKGNPLFEFKLVSSGGSRVFDTSRIIERYDLRIAVSVLADFILLGHEKVGSFALASSKTALFSTALGSFLDSIVETFNSHAIPKLFLLNGLPLDRLPELRHGDVETPDLAALGGFISALAGAGMQLFPDDALENSLRAAASLPAKVAADKEGLDPGATDPVDWEGGGPPEVGAPVEEGTSAGLSKEQLDMAFSIVDRMAESKLSAEAATELLKGVGLQESTIQALLG